MAQTINQIANRYEIISLVGQGGMQMFIRHKIRS